MQKFDISARERIYTQSGAMSLESGRLILAEAVQAIVIMCACWVTGCAAALAVVAVAGGSIYEHSALAALRWFVRLAGGGLAVLLWSGGATLALLLVRGWFRYARRLESWHQAELRAYTAAGGQRVDRALTIRALTLHEPTHLLLVALSVALRAAAGEKSPHSAAALTGAIWIGQITAGELTKGQAEEFSAALHQIGLVRGRRKGYAGELVVTEPAAVVELVSRNYGRVRPGQLAAPAEESSDER